MAEYGHTSNITSGAGGSGVDLLAETWLQRIKNSDEHFKTWNDKFKCDRLENYYLGKQWEGMAPDYEPYTINLIFSTIEIKLPTLLFTVPVFHVKPKPSGSEYDFESAVKRALLREDLLNTIVTDHIVGFSEQIEPAILDAFFRFGIVEVGYEANWVVNPNAGMPILKSDNTPYVDDDNNILRQPEKLPQEERLFVKRIHARRFRVGGVQTGPSLRQSNWCAYWEFVRTEDIKANKNLNNLDKIDWASARSSDFVKDEYGPEIDTLLQSGDLLKIWHVWDNRKKIRYIFADPQTVCLYEKKFERLPLFGLRFHPLMEGWLPMPPVTNWKSPQDEYNEAREQARNHRRRFNRKYLYNIAAFNEDELGKLLNGGDGTFVGINGAETGTAAVPLQNADLGQGSQIGLTVTKDDFNIISGTSEEQRGQADRTTATQANIINQKAQIRDSRSRIQVATWLEEIGRELLLLGEEKFTLPVWVKMAVPSGQGMGEAMPEVSEIWHQISIQDLKDKNEDDFNFDVSLSLDSMSPVENEQDSQSFLQFLAVLNQYPEISSDPLLIREAAYKLGYRNEQVIKRMQKAAQMMLVQKLQQSSGGNPGQSALGGSSPMGQQTVANAQPPLMERITNQLKNQYSGAVKPQ